MKQTRQTSTKKDIRDALTQLLLTEPFESISVSKLTRQAKINRGTFYLHYLDKYDMMDKLKEETIRDLHQLYDPHQSPRDSILALLQYTKENYQFIYAISQSRFIDFSKTSKDFVLQVLERTPDYQKRLVEIYQIPLSYAQEVFLASTESIFASWIATGAKESPEDLTQMMLTVSHLEELTHTPQFVKLS